VTRVFYPGLTSHPQHELAARQASGFGGMISIIPGDGSLGTGRTVFDRFRLFTRADISPMTMPPRQVPTLLRHGGCELVGDCSGRVKSGFPMTSSPRIIRRAMMTTRLPSRPARGGGAGRVNDTAQSGERR